MRAKEAIAVATLVVALISGCDAVNPLKDVPNPLTPEQSKAQVVDAAKDVVGTLDLQVVEAVFWHSSCNDQGDPPFRGQVRLAYPQASSADQSDDEIAKMVQRLENSGWSADSEFRSHGTVLKKNNVVAVLGPQNASVPNRDIQLYGECRDVTTAKGQTQTEDIVLD
jgi:hypothetical protein